MLNHIYTYTDNTQGRTQLCLGLLIYNIYVITSISEYVDLLLLFAYRGYIVFNKDTCFYQYTLRYNRPNVPINVIRLHLYAKGYVNSHYSYIVPISNPLSAVAGPRKHRHASEINLSIGHHLLSHVSFFVR